MLSTRPHLVVLVHQKAFTTALESRPLNDLSPFVMFKTAQNHVETFHQILPEVQTNSCLFISKVNKLEKSFYRLLNLSMEFSDFFSFLNPVKSFKRRVAVTKFLKLFHFDFPRL